MSFKDCYYNSLTSFLTQLKKKQATIPLIFEKYVNFHFPRIRGISGYNQYFILRKQIVKATYCVKNLNHIILVDSGFQLINK